MKPRINACTTALVALNGTHFGLALLGAVHARMPLSVTRRANRFIGLT